VLNINAVLHMMAVVIQHHQHIRVQYRSTSPY